MKSFLLISALVATLTGSAQSEKYMSTMQSRVATLDTTHSVEGMQALANTFERIADAEKTQWLPYYYAALSQVNAGYFLSNGKMGGMADKLDPMADKAETLLNKAEGLSANNSEIFVVKKMIATLRMMGDPMNRYMKFGPQAQQALEEARRLNPENPRVYLLEGQDKYYTPEQFGGSKTEAKRLLEEALKKYDNFKPATSIAPSWGRGTTQYFLSQMK